MHIPREYIESGIKTLKSNLKELYTLIKKEDETSDYYFKIKNEVTRQENIFRGLFGDEIIDKLKNEAWLEYTENKHKFKEYHQHSSVINYNYDKEKRYCKGCLCDVTKRMWCYCAEQPLNKGNTYTESDLEK